MKLAQPTRLWALVSLVGAACVGALPGHHASPDAGVPFIRHFPPAEIGDGPQVIDGVQGSEGRLVFTSNRSILEYDGVEWRQSRIGTARQLVLDAQGRIWVGCDADLGYLESDDRASRFVSLRDSLPESERPNHRILSTAVTDGAVWFVYTHQILRWQNGEVDSWRAEDGEEFQAGAGWQDQLYVYQTTRGLLTWPPESAPATPEPLSGKITSILPWADQVFLLATDNGKIHLWRDGQIETFSVEAERHLASAAIRELVRWRENDGKERIAVASRGAGLLILNADGDVTQHLTSSHGLPSDEVYGVVRDAQGSLWLGTSPGIARLSSVPITYYHHTPESPRSLLRVARYQGDLYLGGVEGAYRLRPSEGPEPAHFEPISGLRTTVGSWAATPRGLLTATPAGLFEVAGGRAKSLADEGRTIVWAEEDGVALVTADNLLRLLVPESSGWRFLDYPDFLPERIYEVHPDGPGAFWLLTPGSRKLYRLSFPDGLESSPQLKSFDAIAPWARPIRVEGRLGIRDGMDVFFFDEATADRRADSRFALADWIPPGKDRYELRATAGGDLWLTMRDRALALEKGPDGGFQLAPRQIALASRLNFDTHADPGQPDILWLATDLGPARFDTRYEPSASVTPNIRFLPPETGDGSSRSDETLPILPFSTEAIRFEVSAPHYQAESLTEYRFRLNGLSDLWSTWTDEPVKEYTNLSGADYRFEVEARNAGRLLGQADLAFRVLPPWYQTWWLRLLAALGFFGVLAVWARGQRRKVARQQAIAERERSINQHLQTVDKLKDEFLANTSHELRTPLYGITGLAESLIDGAAGEVSDTMRSNLSMIVSSGRRLSHLVNDILDFSKLRHKSLELNRRPVELHALVDVVLTLSAPLTQGKDLSLVNSVSKDLPAADADEDRLQQILHNLIGNAVKFTAAGSIEVSAQATDSRLEVRVVDTGIGIAREEQERIFDAFEQADGSLERETGGTGLGLAITRQLVELHGGSLRVTSTPGQGSTFIFDLPIAGGDQAPEAPSRDVVPFSTPALAEEASSQEGDSKDALATLLVVDDEPVNRRVLVNQLATEGYRVIQAAGGAEALRSIEEERPDLVLLDVMMPRVSGYEVCQTLRQQFSLDQLPVIFLTAKTQPSALVVGLAAGANDYLPKPVSKSELVARVKTHLELADVHRQLSELVDERTSQLHERERLLAERERLIDQLETRNQELARFNYTVAHDLKNPLTTIKNFVGLVARDADAGDLDRLRQDLERVDRAANHLELLLEELYQLSQVEEAQGPRVAVALGNLLQAVCDELSSTVTPRGIEIELAPNLPVVCGDPRQLKQAFVHLLSNAVRYLGDQPHPRIEIGEYPQERGPAVFIRDNGIGIDPQYQEKIFGLFERLDHTGSGGTGVGLALVKRIIQAHGGEVWIESEGLGKGSTVYVLLPAADPDC